ncbi:MAG: glycine-rich protein [bacterium]
MNISDFKKSGRQKGAVAILLTLLILSITLLIGVGLSGVFFNELKISDSVRQSGPAFYAADAGAEYSLYQKYKVGVISGSGSFFLPYSKASYQVSWGSNFINSLGAYSNSRRKIEVNFPSPPPTGTVTFNYNGSQQTWIVPADVNSITVDVKGAQGANGHDANSPYAGATPGTGARGGRTQATISTTPGETLYIYVGGVASGYTGGYNNGGSGGNDVYGAYGGGGGGASDIRRGGTALTNRVAVAAGGGGGGGSLYSPGELYYYNGGNGGAGGGTSGTVGAGAYDQYGNTYPTYSWLATGGGSGTASSGGAGGCNYYYGVCMSPGGSLGTGGPGMVSVSNVSGGGGGGAGYYGGGGGGGRGGGGGGGGGSGWAISGSNPTYTSGYQTGNGQIIINY